MEDEDADPERGDRAMYSLMSFCLPKPKDNGEEDGAPRLNVTPEVLAKISAILDRFERFSPAQRAVLERMMLAHGAPRPVDLANAETVEAKPLAPLVEKYVSGALTPGR